MQGDTGGAAHARTGRRSLASAPRSARPLPGKDSARLGLDDLSRRPGREHARQPPAGPREELPILGLRPLPAAGDHEHLQVGLPAALSTRYTREGLTATTRAEGRRDTVGLETWDSVLVS